MTRRPQCPTCGCYGHSELTVTELLVMAVGLSFLLTALYDWMS